MDREGLDKIKRAEFVARLDLLERFVAEQEARVAMLHARGWDAKESERRLELLRESHRLYLAALLRQLGERLGEPESDTDRESDT